MFRTRIQTTDSRVALISDDPTRRGARRPNERGASCLLRVRVEKTSLLVFYFTLLPLAVASVGWDCSVALLRGHSLRRAQVPSYVITFQTASLYWKVSVSGRSLAVCGEGCFVDRGSLAVAVCDVPCKFGYGWRAQLGGGTGVREKSAYFSKEGSARVWDMTTAAGRYSCGRWREGVGKLRSGDGLR